MKTLLLSISLTFSLVASAQPQTALNCADDTEGVNAREIKTEPGSDGTPWNHSVNKDKAYYKGALYTGIVKVCGKNTGKVISKLSFKYGIKDGLSYKYHKEGWLQWKKNYADGKEEGHQKYFYPSAVMAINNNTAGKTPVTNLNRRIKESYWANNGEKNGKAWAYYANGDIKYLEKYDNGVKHGDQVYYYEDSIVAKKEYYANGSKSGDWIYYDKKGTIIEKATWKSGKQTDGYKLIRGKKLVYSNGSVIYEDFSIYVWFENFNIEDYSNVSWGDGIQDAKDICTALGDGWRLPTKNELAFLYDYKKDMPNFSSPNSYCSSGEHYLGTCCFISSTTCECDNFKDCKKEIHYWGKCFFNGETKKETMKNDDGGYKVRAVRAF